MPTVMLPTGTRCFFQTTGSGAPVLCLQGVGVIGNGWRPQLDGLGDEFQLIAPDNRGIGQTPRGEDEITVEHYAADALALLDALEIERVHLIGHSLGGSIAQQLALDAPERVASLALLCTFFRSAYGARVTPRAIWVGLRTLVGTRRMRRAAFLSNVLPAEALRARHIDALHDELAPLFGRDLATLPRIVMEQVRALSMHDGSQRWAELDAVETLVVAGAQDVIAPPEQGQAIAAAIPNATYVEFSDAAHGLPITHADRVNGILRGHLAHKTAAE